MFCSEPIKRVLQMELREDVRPDWCDSLFQITYRFEYHTTDGFWILFETKSFYITVGFDGVIKYEKPYEFSTERFAIEAFGDGRGGTYEDLIFRGQRILSVEEFGNGALITFDDFAWKLCSYKENGSLFHGLSGGGDHAVPVGGHLLRSCACGGNPEIYLDRVTDFFIRCESCHRATYADMYFRNAMNEWNKSKTPITVETSTEKFNRIVREQEVKRIILSERGFEECDEGSSWTDAVIIEFEKDKILVQTTAIGDDASKICFNSISAYNPEIFSKTVSPTFGQLKFLGLHNAWGREGLLFALDDTELDIFSSGCDFSVSLTEPCDNPNAKRTKLFN